MQDDLNERWLVRYLAGECSEEEKRSIEEWIASDPELRDEISCLQKIWNTPAEEKQQWDIEEGWQRFRRYDKRFSGSRNQGNIYILPTSRKKRIRSGVSRPAENIYKWGIVAVTVAAVIAISFLFLSPQNIPQKAPPPTMRVVTAYKGEKIHLHLSDGTRILLNADSRLKIPDHFSDSTRDVYLQGEAYFEVVHQAGKPFLVHAGHSVTRDLSTRFIVQAYPEYGHTKVVVTEGRVVMNEIGSSQAPSTGTIIPPHHIGVLQKDGTVQVSRVKNLMNWMGWTKGKLVFNNTPLTQVIPQLERWYDLNITLKDSTIGTRRLTATYIDREPMDEVLDAIALALDIKYDRKNYSVIMYDKRQNR